MSNPDQSYERMFHAACLDLAAINEALDLDPDDGGAVPILDAIAELKARVAPTEAAAMAATVPDPGLMKFYAVSTTAELIAAQAAHIERLQAKLPQAPSFAPQRVREG